MPSLAAIRAGFRPVPVVLMVLGFAVSWPLGLGILVYIVFGEHFGWRPRVAAFFSGLHRGLRETSCRCGPTVFDVEAMRRRGTAGACPTPSPKDR